MVRSKEHEEAITRRSKPTVFYDLLPKEERERNLKRCIKSQRTWRKKHPNYGKEWKRKNRERWNAYLRNYRRKKRVQGNETRSKRNMV